MADPLKLHDEKKAELADLYKRMDDDQDLITKVDYVMKDKAGKAVDNVISMQGNRPQVFAAYVEAALNKADEKIYVESDDESLDTSVIEDAIRDIFDSVNAKRRRQGLWGIDPVLDQFNCRRGGGGIRVLCQELPGTDGEHYIDIDMSPWDRRYTTVIMGSDGIAQAGLEMTKAKDVIESESWAIEQGFTISGKSAVTVEIWTPKANYIYVDKNLVFEQANIWGFVPVVFQNVPIGSMLSDEDNAVYEGESYLFMIRHLIPEFSRLVSILQTKNFEAVMPPIQVKTDGNLDNDFYVKATAPGAATPVKDLNAIHPIQFEGIKQSALVLLQEINSAIDDGSLSRITLGALPSGGLSAVALLQVEQGQGQVYMPRLGTRGLQKQGAAEMAIAQILALKQSSIELGAKGHKKVYQTAKLQGEYDISFVYTNKNPESDYARLSIGKGYVGVLDELTILSDILKRDDPEGDLAKLKRQQLRQLVPPLQIYDGLVSLSKLYEDGDESVAPEIEIAEQYLNITLDQMKAGQLPQQGQVEQPSGETEIPVIAGGVSSSKKAADLKRTMVEDTGGE